MRNELIAIAIAVAFPLGTMAASTESGAGTGASGAGISVGAGGNTSGGMGATGPGGGTSGSLGSVGTTGGSSGMSGPEKPGGTLSGSGAAATPQGTASGRAAAGGSSSQQLDTNKDGYISREEAAASSDIRSRFNTLDKDGDGRLSPQELSGGGRASGSGQPGSMGTAK